MNTPTKKSSGESILQAKPEKNQKIYTQYMDLEQLQAAPTNPKLHDPPDIGESIQRFGMAADDIAIDERTGRIISGHGRREALLEMKKLGQPPPPEVEVGPDGEWLAPVRRGWESADDTEAEAAALAVNELGTKGGYDFEKLRAALERVKEKPSAGMAGTGFDRERLERIIQNLTRHTNGEFNPEDEWQGMPEFESEDQSGTRPIIIHFKSEEDRQSFADFIDQKITEKTKYIWYPEQERIKQAGLSYE